MFNKISIKKRYGIFKSEEGPYIAESGFFSDIYDAKNAAMYLKVLYPKVVVKEINRKQMLKSRLSRIGSFLGGLMLSSSVSILFLVIATIILFLINEFK